MRLRWAVAYWACWVCPVLIGCGAAERRPCVQPGRVKVRVGATVSAERIDGGVAASCDDPVGAPLRARLSPLLWRLPRAVQPPTLVIQLDPHLGPRQPALRGIAVHRASGHVLLPRSVALTIDDSAWLHEIAHVALARPAPGHTPAGRLLAAMEEGMADYFAAAQLGHPRLGEVHDRVARDLSAAPTLSAAEWAGLAGIGAAWRPHRAGWSLAGHAWSHAGPDRALATDLLIGLRRIDPQASRGPRDLVTRWRRHCPERSRTRLDALLSAWMPGPLLR